MRKTQIRNSLLLLLAATIWGVAFVAQSVGMDYVGGFTFNFVRNIIGGCVLIPVVIFLKGKDSQKSVEHNGKMTLITRDELIGGICCGLVLCAASNFQQFGIAYTTVGKAGFITAMYVVLVPVLGLFFHRKVSKTIWFCVGLSVYGLYLLCMTAGSFSLQFGDLLVLVCALLFSFHIMVVDHFTPRGSGVAISCIQFFTCGIVSGVLTFLFETPTLSGILAAWMPILYAGALSSGVAYTLQIVGQKDMNPTLASLIMCLESVISALAGWLLLHQALSARELMGCALMFIAIVISQIKG